MAARCALLFVALLLTLHTPGLGKTKSSRSAKSSAAIHNKVKSAKSAPAKVPERKAAVSSETLEQPAVLEPDGTEDENPSSKALYTDSDDVG